MRDSTFITGFWVGLATAVVAAWLFGQIAALWNKVLQPFRPSEKPAKLPTEMGPSPAAQFGNWLSSVVLFLIVLVIIGALIWVMVGGASR